MNIERLLNWHKSRVKAMTHRKRVDMMDDETRELYFMHVEAVKIIELLEPNYRAAKLAEVEVIAKAEAIHSLRKLAQALLAEAKDMAQMYQPVPPALLHGQSDDPR